MFAILGVLFVLLAKPAFAGDCPTIAETGRPTIADTAGTQLVCHTAYASQVDLTLNVPRWVAYPLTGDHTLGCNARKNNFHAEQSLPADHRATPADYAKSGFDIGHQMPAADAEWDAAAMSDTFSLANMAPQLPGLNRWEWEVLEENVRAWAWGRGEVVVFVGPIIAAGDASIGEDHVDVPSLFWKVVYDPAMHQALAFEMPQRSIPKGPIEPWQVSVDQVETDAAIALPIKADRGKATLWPADLPGWRKAHAAACGSD